MDENWPEFCHFNSVFGLDARPRQVNVLCVLQNGFNDVGMFVA